MSLHHRSIVLIKFSSSLISFLIGFLAVPIIAFAFPVLSVQQGGTGWNNIQNGALLYGNGSGALSTTTAASNGQLLAFLNGAWTATATSTYSSPLSFNVNTNAVSIQAATAAQAGYETQNEFNYVHSATTTFTYPLIYTGSTNAVTFPATSTLYGTGTGGQYLVWANGVPTWTASTTYSAPLVFSAGNVTCNTASGSQTGCLSSGDWTTFNNKQSTLTFSTPLILNGTTVTFSGISTTSAPASSNLLVSNGGSGVYGVATSSETCSAPILCGAHTVLSGGGAISFTGTLALASGGTNASLSGANSIIFMNSANTALVASSTLVFTVSNSLGISTSTPWAELSVVGDLSRPLFAIATSTNGNSTSTEPIFMLDQNEHRIYGGALPTVSGCGTSPQIVGNDNVMRLTTGSTGVTACTITFAKSWAPYPAPTCTFDEQGLTATVTIVGSTTQTTLKMGLSASLTSATIGIQCEDYFQ